MKRSIGWDTKPFHGYKDKTTNLDFARVGGKGGVADFPEICFKMSRLFRVTKEGYFSAPTSSLILHRLIPSWRQADWKQKLGQFPFSPTKPSACWERMKFSSRIASYMKDSRNHNKWWSSHGQQFRNVAHVIETVTIVEASRFRPSRLRLGFPVIFYTSIPYPEDPFFQVNAASSGIVNVQLHIYISFGRLVMD